ncbi:MAG: hypothetical protein LBT09_05660 [Planctomycetaceae bacterium]|jgi:hypothetical protein|nr:hypothetical protein [Planctomycetaceae bacterium]
MGVGDSFYFIRDLPKNVVIVACFSAANGNSNSTALSGDLLTAANTNRFFTSSILTRKICPAQKRFK